MMKYLLPIAWLAAMPASADAANDSRSDLELVEVAEEIRRAPVPQESAIVFEALPKNMVLAEGGTSLGEVFASVDTHAPQLVKARAQVERAAAAELQALGDFDAVLSGKYSGRLTGFYGGQVGDIAVKQRLRNLNAEVYGGYTVSSGTLPVYEDELLTNEGGEVRAGARFALLRGRETDSERTRLANARRNTAAAGASAEAERIAIKAAAAKAYVDWLFAENVRRVYTELYSIADERNTAIESAVRAGELAEITLDENRQLLLARQGQLLSATQDAVEAKAVLSLFLRDGTGNPKAPVLGLSSEVPQTNPYASTPLPEISRRVVESRPDLLEGRIRLEAMAARARLAENDLQPDLSFSYEFRRDFGDRDIERIGADHKVGLELNVPIQLSRARGDGAAVRAEMKGLRADLRLIEDQAGLALSANQQALLVTEQQLIIGVNEIEIAQTLREAEETRYLAGASDVFRLNAQETAFANSRLRLLRAQREHDLLLIDFFRITGTLWFPNTSDAAY